MANSPEISKNQNLKALNRISEESKELSVKLTEGNKELNSKLSETNNKIAETSTK